MLLAGARLRLRHRLFIGTLIGFNHPGRIDRRFLVLPLKSLEDLFLKTLCFLFNFQEVIQENSVTMNKMRLLKTRMESQKNLKVCWIPEETFFLWSYEVLVLFPLLHATLLRPLVLLCMCFLWQTSGVGTMLLHDSGYHSKFTCLWKVINSHLSSTNTSLQWPLHLSQQIQWKHRKL